MSTYIRYAKTTKLMINNVVYIISTSILDFLEPVDTFEEYPEAAYAAQQANCETDCKQIHFLSVFKSYT